MVQFSCRNSGSRVISKLAIFPGCGAGPVGESTQGPGSGGCWVRYWAAVVTIAAEIASCSVEESYSQRKAIGVLSGNAGTDIQAC
jgi:hypothetical protein